MASFTQKTLSMAAGNGYVVSVGSANSVSILARAACFVQIVSQPSAPTAPVATPAPGSGLQASWLDMQANEVQTLGVDNPSASVTTMDVVNYVVVWAVSTGNLVVNAH